MDEWQIASFILSFLNVLLIVIWLRQNPKYRLLAVPIIIFVGHTMIFYIVRALSVWGVIHLPFLTPFTIWSSYLRFHGSVTILLYTAYYTKLSPKLVNIIERVRIWMYL